MFSKSKSSRALGNAVGIANQNPVQRVLDCLSQIRSQGSGTKKRRSRIGVEDRATSVALRRYFFHFNKN